MLGFKKKGTRQAEPAVYVTFYTTAESFAFASTCQSAGVAGRLVTIPRCLSAGCGMAWRAPVDERPRIEALIAADALEHEDICVLES